MQKIKTLFFFKEVWQRNLVVLWFGCFMTGVGASLISPFLALYIDSLGNFSKQSLNLWSGLVFASTYLITAIVSPLWGRLADQKGRKLMLLRAAVGMGISIFLMGFVTQVWQLLALRMLLGLFSGFTSNSTALIATATPKKYSGKVLGTLATGTVGGTLLGPIIGGGIVQATGYRTTFFITGIILLLVFLLALFFVKEDFIPIEKTDIKNSPGIFAKLPYRNLILGMFLTTFMIQLTNMSISPILSLYVREIMHQSGNITLMSGVVASISGIATLLAAPRFGILGDKIGTQKILLGGLVISFIVFIPMIFVTNIWQMVALRFIMGLADAALVPSVQAILMRFTPSDVTGRIFSYNQSAQSLGAVVGPIVGSLVAGYFDYRYVFLVTAIFVCINLVSVLRYTKKLTAQI